ncbi:MAG: thiamine phosphate synthase [Clostridiales bacterium]|nr:thiamine phosphate synthase [Clostridiales bacterium]
MKIEAKAMTLYAVTDRSWLRPGERLSEPVEELLKAGVTCVQLREKEADDELFLQEALELKELCGRYEVPLIINDRVDIAKQSGADGVHVGLSDMGIEKARAYLGDGFIIGGSAHNVEEALAAERAGADYIGCGAVFGSTTKTDVTTLSKEELRAICRAVSIPVVAIGGINRENVKQLLGTGMDGVAVISALFGAADKTAAAKEFLELLKGERK